MMKSRSRVQNALADVHEAQDAFLRFGNNIERLVPRFHCMPLTVSSHLAKHQRIFEIVNGRTEIAVCAGRVDWPPVNSPFRTLHTVNEYFEKL